MSFRKEGVSTIKMGFGAGGNGQGDVHAQYHKLLMPKTLRPEKEWRKEIINARKRLLQKRIFCDITLVGDGQEAKITVYHTLLEYGEEMANWWLEKEIDPSSFPVYVKAFEAHMQSRDIKSVQIVSSPTKRYKVRGVGEVFSFA